MTYHTRSHILPQLLIQNYAWRDWWSWEHNHTFKRSYIHRDKRSNSHTHIHTATHTHTHTRYTCSLSQTHTQITQLHLRRPSHRNRLSFMPETDGHSRVQPYSDTQVHTVTHTHCHTAIHSDTVSPEAPAWSPSRSLPVYPKPGPDLWLSRQPGPTHLPASLALETRPATRDPRRRLPESPAGHSGTRTDAHRTPGSAGETSSCKELDQRLSFSFRPWGPQVPDALRLGLLAEWTTFPRGPRSTAQHHGCTTGGHGHKSEYPQNCVITWDIVNGHLSDPGQLHVRECWSCACPWLLLSAQGWRFGCDCRCTLLCLRTTGRHVLSV